MHVPWCLASNMFHHVPADHDIAPAVMMSFTSQAHSTLAHCMPAHHTTAIMVYVAVFKIQNIALQDVSCMHTYMHLQLPMIKYIHSL